MGGLTVNGLAFLVLLYLFVKGYVETRVGLVAAVLAALTLPMLGPVGEGAARIASAVTPLINSIGSAGGGAVG